MTSKGEPEPQDPEPEFPEETPEPEPAESDARRIHPPAMVVEALDYLRCKTLADEGSPLYKADAVFIDGTLGTGGHTLAMLQAHPTCRVVAFDRDAESQEFALRRIAEAGFPDRVTPIHGDFRQAPELLQPYLDNLKVGSDGRPILRIDGALVDAGMSLFQISWAERGLSFRQDGPLDMRYSRDQGVTAADLVNRLSQNELEDLFFHLADEGWARRIAVNITEFRRTTPIHSTLQLARLVEEAIPLGVRRKMRVHPATQCFAALRLAVNDEFWALSVGSWALSTVLHPSARLVVLTYSSNEDRTLKRTFRSIAGRDGSLDPSDPAAIVPGFRSGRPPKRGPRNREVTNPSLVSQAISLEFPFERESPIPEFATGWGKTWIMKILTSRPVEPSAAEIAANPLSRSCKLRALEKIALHPGPAEDARVEQPAS